MAGGDWRAGRRRRRKRRRRELGCAGRQVWGFDALKVWSASSFINHGMCETRVPGRRDRAAVGVGKEWGRGAVIRGKRCGEG